MSVPSAGSIPTMHRWPMSAPRSPIHPITMWRTLTMSLLGVGCGNKKNGKTSYIAIISTNDFFNANTKVESVNDDGGGGWDADRDPVAVSARVLCVRLKGKKHGAVKKVEKAAKATTAADDPGTL